jgi:hypothetical protein
MVQVHTHTESNPALVDDLVPPFGTVAFVLFFGFLMIATILAWKGFKKLRTAKNHTLN